MSSRTIGHLVPKNSSVYYENNTEWRKSLWNKYDRQKARTTESIRREIRHSKEIIAKAAVRFNVNPKISVKWRKREDTKDAPMGPKKVKSTVLSEAEEEAIGTFRKRAR